MMITLKTLCLWLLCASVFGQDIPPPPPPPPGYSPEVRPGGSKQDRPLLLSRRIPVNIQSKLTGLHERVRGTRLFFLPSDRFVYDGIKFVDKTDSRYFYLLVEKNASYSKTMDSIERNILQVNGHGLHTNITINSKIGKIIEMVEPDGKNGLSLVMAGDDSLSMFGMFYYDLSNKEMMDIVVKTIGSLYHKTDYPLTPGETFDFTFKDTLTGFKLAQYQANTAFYTIDGKYSEKDFFKTNYQLTNYPYLKAQQINNVFDYMPELMKSTFNITFKLLNTDLKVIDDQITRIVEYDVQNERGDGSGRCYVAIVQGKNSCVFFQGFSTSDHEAYQKKWLQIIYSIHFKTQR